MNTLRLIVKYIDTVTEWIGRIVSWLLLLLMALAVYEVFTRRVLGKPTIWTFEASGYALAAVVMLSLGYTLLHKGHVNVDLVYERFSPRNRALIDIITFFPFLGLFCAVFLVEGTEFAATSWSMLERTPSAFNPPIYPIKTLIPVGTLLLALVAVSQLIKNIVFFVKGEEL